MVLEESGLIDEVRSGKSSSFAILVERYKDMVFTLCARMLKDRMLAEELAQDVFMKAYHNISQYQNRSKFSTWLYSIAYRACLSELRKRKVIEVDIQDLQINGESNSGLINLLEKDRNVQLKKAINSLKEEEQIFIQLFYLEEQSIKEIAQITGASESNVKVKLHRSKNKLRLFIEEFYPELQRNVV